MIAVLPRNDGWTFCFEGEGSGLTANALNRLCAELRRIQAPGLEILASLELDDEGLLAISKVTSLRTLAVGDRDHVIRSPENPCRMTARVRGGTLSDGAPFTISDGRDGQLNAPGKPSAVEKAMDS